MLYAQKSNRVQKISEAEVEKFLNLGYDIVDDKANVIHEAMPSDVQALQTAFRKHVETIKSLEAEIAQLKAKSTKTRSTKEKETTTEE